MAGRFIDLFAGMGGFHRALTRLGFRCVFASEIDDELRKLYITNFKMHKNVFGDIRDHAAKNAISRHDVLCAGFPCQPFSKSGFQLGTDDPTRGTLFHEIVEIADRYKPKFLLLENVGNFEKHDKGRTWEIARSELQRIGYDVRGTNHKSNGGHGLISPHQYGYPHHRERFFIVASRVRLPDDPFPATKPTLSTSLWDVVLDDKRLRDSDRAETKLTAQQTACIELWNRFLAALPEGLPLPPGPIWSDEFGAEYPFEDTTPLECSTGELARTLGMRGEKDRAKLLEHVPPYAKRPGQFPEWKKRFIRINRKWYEAHASLLPADWLKEIKLLPWSLRKLEWNCGDDGKRDLWECVLQFRPSGLRAKRFTSVPALVAMTTTQIPILGPKRRFITRKEGLRLQGFPVRHRLPKSRERAFAALGNAVHVNVVEAIMKRLLEVTKNAQPYEPEQQLDRVI